MAPAPAQVQQLEAAIEEALEGESWVDCLPLVPPVLSAADTVDLLSKVPAAQQLGRRLLHSLHAGACSWVQ